MRIEQLEQVIKIAECGSLNKAAGELYMSQSNLSQSLMALERTINQIIFKRTGKGMEPTAFGIMFLDYALSTVTQYHQTLEFSKSYNRSPALNFAVACQYLRFANLLFMQLYKKYTSQGSVFSFFECSFMDILDNIATHRAEVGIVFISQREKRTHINLMSSRGIVYNPLMECSISINVGKQNPLYYAEQQEVTLEMLKGFPRVLFRDIHYNFATEISLIAFTDPKDKLVVTDLNTLMEVVRNSDAYSFSIYTNAYEKIPYYEGIRALKLKDGRQMLELGWISNNNRPLSTLAKEYIGMVEDVLKGDTEHPEG